MKLALVFLLACWFFLRANDCKLALVTWESPTTLTSVADGKLTLTTQSIGCVDVQEQTVLIIRTLENGRAKDALAIPLGSVTSITTLEVSHDSRPTPQVLPNVQDQEPTRTSPTRPNLLVRLFALWPGGLL